MTTVAELVGAVLIAAGAALIFVPAGLIVAGLLAIAFGFLGGGGDEPSAKP